jgi:hypothetical protein
LHARKEVYLLLDATYEKYSVPGMANLGDVNKNLDGPPAYPVTAKINYGRKVLEIYDAMPGGTGKVPTLP